MRSPETLLQQTLQEEEEEDGKTGANRQRDDPGDKDRAHYPQINSRDTAGDANTEYSTYQGVGNDAGEREDA